MRRFKPGFLELASFVTAVIGFVAFIFPGLREWMAQNWIVGWTAFFAALAIAPLLAVAYAARVLRRATTDAEERATVAAEAASALAIKAARDDERALVEVESATKYANRDKDVRLIEERLGGWTHNSKFFKYICEYASPNHFRRDVAHDISDHVEGWERDDRQIVDTTLNASWQSVRDAADEYCQSIFNHMWAEDDGEGGPSNEEFLRVPIEWKTYDYERSTKAHLELEQNRIKLIRSLRVLFAKLHAAAPPQ